MMLIWAILCMAALISRLIQTLIRIRQYLHRFRFAVRARGCITLISNLVLGGRDLKGTKTAPKNVGNFSDPS